MSIYVELTCRRDMRRLGRCIAHCVGPGDVVYLEGELGAGKTFLVRAIARALGVPAEVAITSPTFELVHEFEGRLPIVHADLYRLDDASALDDTGLLDRVGASAVALIEWGERSAEQLGGGVVLRIELGEGSRRSCSLEAVGARGAALLGRLRALGLGAGSIPRLARPS